MGKILKHVIGIAAIGCLMSGVEAYAASGIKAGADLSIAQEAQPTGPGFQNANLFWLVSV